METINAIAPLLNPDITNDEARAVVAAMTEETRQHLNMLILELARKDTLARKEKA